MDNKDGDAKGGLETIKRNIFNPRAMLEASDLNDLQNNILLRHRVINKNVIGSGIVTGLEVSVRDEYCLNINSGVAIDKEGCEIIVDQKIEWKVDAHIFDDSNPGIIISFYLYIVFDEDTSGSAMIYSEGYANITQPNRVTEKYKIYLSKTQTNDLLLADVKVKDKKIVSAICAPHMPKRMLDNTIGSGVLKLRGVNFKEAGNGLFMTDPFSHSLGTVNAEISFYLIHNDECYYGKTNLNELRVEGYKVMVKDGTFVVFVDKKPVGEGVKIGWIARRL